MRLILPGDPYLALRASKGQSIWNDSHLMRLHYEKILEDAIPEHKIKGPIHVSVTFYLVAPDLKKHGIHFYNNSKHKQGYHHELPIMSDLIRMMELLVTGRIIDSRSSLASLVAYKMYDEHPRVEIEINKIKG